MEPKTKRKKYSEQPRDLQSAVSILQKMGIDKFEGNVPHMLLEFAHTYSQEVLDEARSYAEYAKHPQKIEVADLKYSPLPIKPRGRLAIDAYDEKYFSRPMSVPSLCELAELKSQIPIPPPPAASSTA